MAYVAKCSDLGKDCPAVMRADTMDELKQKMAEHGKAVHDLDMTSMSPDELQKVMSIVRQE